MRTPTHPLSDWPRRWREEFMSQANRPAGAPGNGG
jgi:hypothetical protein